LTTTGLILQHMNQKYQICNKTIYDQSVLHVHSVQSSFIFGIMTRNCSPRLLLYNDKYTNKKEEHKFRGKMCIMSCMSHACLNRNHTVSIRFNGVLFINGPDCYQHGLKGWFNERRLFCLQLDSVLLTTEWKSNMLACLVSHLYRSIGASPRHSWSVLLCEIWLL